MCVSPLVDSDWVEHIFRHKAVGQPFSYQPSVGGGRVQTLYLEGKKDAAGEAVPQEMVEGSSLIGSKEEVLTRLAAYARAGVTALNLVPAGRTLAERVEQYERREIHR